MTALVSEGISNPESAVRLSMGRGMVETHSAQIFAKPGVASRTELASLAAHGWQRSERRTSGGASPVGA